MVYVYIHTRPESLLKVVFLYSSPVTDDFTSFSYFMILCNADEFIVMEATKYNSHPKIIVFIICLRKFGNFNLKIKFLLF